jgi:hypothetical protein
MQDSCRELCPAATICVDNFVARQQTQRTLEQSIQEANKKRQELITSHAISDLAISIEESAIRISNEGLLIPPDASPLTINTALDNIASYSTEKVGAVMNIEQYDTMLTSLTERLDLNASALSKAKSAIDIVDEAQTYCKGAKLSAKGILLHIRRTIKASNNPRRNWFEYIPPENAGRMHLMRSGHVRCTSKFAKSALAHLFGS